MPNEQLERYLIELLRRLSTGEADSVLEAFLVPTERESYFVSNAEGSDASTLGRRILREEERLALASETEGFLIELQEIGLLTPPLVERLLDRLQDTDLAAAEVEDAANLASLLLRTESSCPRRRSHLILDSLGGEMTLH